MLEEEPESEAEERERTVSEKVFVVNLCDEALRQLEEKVSHVPPQLYQRVVYALQESGIIASSLDDLHPADVPVEHRFELKDTKILSLYTKLGGNWPLDITILSDWSWIRC